MPNLKTLSPIIEELIFEIQKQTDSISKIKPADSSKKEIYNHFLKKTSMLRGRDLFYPYISSGLGKGPFVQLADGSVKLDFICGIGPHILGHSHPDLIKASLQGALQDVAMQGHLMMGEIYNELLENLISIAGKKSRLSQAWLCPSGSMANENALKIIRQKKKGARKILAFERAFAGRTTLMSEITDNPSIKKGLPSYNEVLRVPFCPKEPQQALDILKKHWTKESSEIACFMLEPIQGDGGVFPANSSFLTPLLDFCKSKEITIWFDEIQTFARSGEFFAFEKLNLGSYVDICTIGKAFQMSATLWSKEYNPQPGLISGTFASSSSSFYVALNTLNQLQPMMGPEGRIEKIHKSWVSKLQVLENEGLLSEISGLGLMTGVSPLKQKSSELLQLLKKLFQKGLICFKCGHGEKNRLRFLMPAIVEEQDLNQAIQILKEALLEQRDQ